MGNQQSNFLKTHHTKLQNLLKNNRHFNNQFISNFDNNKLDQLMAHLLTPIQNKEKCKGQVQKKCNINCLHLLDEFSFEKTHARLAQRMNQNHPHIINIKSTYIQQHKNLCSLTRRVHILQDGYDYTFKELTKQKIIKKQSFSEEEILLILSKITEAVIWMHDNQFRNIPLDPEAILFVKQGQDSCANDLDGLDCKIIDQDIVQTNSYKQFIQTLISYKTSSHQQAACPPVLNFYLSSQLLQEAKKQNFYPSNITLKSDIFTLGMLMMELCCQEEMYFCYDLESMMLDYESLIHRIAKISYSNELKLLLAEMLEYDENNRIGFISLKEKLNKMMVKPFEETKKLKRRSSSTMLKQLLSCSRASASVQNKLTNQKNTSSIKISDVKNFSEKSEEKKESVKEQNQGPNHNHSLRKTNSLVNLKCKTNSFLTSKKSTLLTRVNSNAKLQTNEKKTLVKETTLQTNRVDYRNVLRNRLKTEPKILDCPEGDGKLNQDIQTNSIVFGEDQQKNEIKMETGMRKNNLIENVSCYTEPVYTEEKESTITSNKHDIPKPQMVSRFSYVKKKVINFDKIKISSQSSQKLNKSNLLRENNQIEVKKNDLIIQTNQNQHKIQIKELQNKIEDQVSVLKNEKTKNNKIKQGNIKRLNLNTKKEAEANVSNKSWIMGKLKAKQSLAKKSTENLSKNKNDKSANKTQTSLTKTKQIVIPPSQQSNKNILQATAGQQNPMTFNKNDTIIRRLQLTDEKFQQLINESQNVQIQQAKIKDQMEMINKVLEKCQLSSSRWQEDSDVGKNQSFLRHENFVKYSDLKGKLNNIQPQAQPSTNQFKKKAKVIDIDLCRIPTKNEQKNNKAISFSVKNKKQTSLKKNQQKPQSKLQKLKQLKIFTSEEYEQNTKEKTTCENLHHNKENSMHNSNLSSLMSNQQIMKITNNFTQQIKKQPILQNNTIKNYNEIPYQRIQYLNYTTVANQQQSLITPSNLKELNKVYGKGMTVESLAFQTYNQNKKEYSTLSKPFQEIELNYKENEPDVASPNLFKEQCGSESHLLKKSNMVKESELFSIQNSQELTFRLKAKNSKGKQQASTKTVSIILNSHQPQKANFFQKEDGSFVMREQNPQKQIQTSSIIGQSKNSHRNTIEQLFKESSKCHNKQFDSIYEGYQESLCNESKQEDCLKSQRMDSSCNSINLSQIEHTAHKGESFLFPEQQKKSGYESKKLKHISILEPEQENQSNHNNLSINLKQIQKKTVSKQYQENYPIVETDRQSEYNTYRQYLSSNECTSKIIELEGNFFYEGEVNQQGEFEGNGMICRRIYSQGTIINDLVYTGSFVNGLYHGFGTLYEIENATTKRLKLPNPQNRISFGVQRSLHFCLSHQPIKYEGQFCEGQENGFGTYFYQNGDKFSGCIKQGKIEGYGTYHFIEDGNSVSGIWKNNTYTDC